MGCDCLARRLKHTLDFGEAETEMIALFQDALPAPFNEIVETRSKARHLLTEPIIAEINAW